MGKRQDGPRPDGRKPVGLRMDGQRSRPQCQKNGEGQMFILGLAPSPGDWQLNRLSLA